MPAQMARAFTLHAIDGRDTDEVCEELGITPGNLWVLLHRARNKLRDAIDGDSHEYFLAAR
jgi:RNA polymerase sigma-70 factor (ECF subfamily)